MFQQGTYAPDATYRWMGSIGDGQGRRHRPGLQRLEQHHAPRDPVHGKASRGPGRADAPGRGDRLHRRRLADRRPVAMGRLLRHVVDPADDCTFWYTNEYIPANGIVQLADPDRRRSSSRSAAAPRRTTSRSARTPDLSHDPGRQRELDHLDHRDQRVVGVGDALASAGCRRAPQGRSTPTRSTRAGSSTLTIATAPNTPTGTYTLTVTGTAPPPRTPPTSRSP